MQFNPFFFPFLRVPEQVPRLFRTLLCSLCSALCFEMGFKRFSIFSSLFGAFIIIPTRF